MADQMKEILLIRSSSLLFEKVFQELAGKSRITVLVDSPASEVLVKRPDIFEIICAGKGRGFRLRDSFRFWKMIRHRRFDEVIVLYNNQRGKGYANVDWFALLTPAVKRLAQNYNRMELPVSIWHFLVKIGWEITGIFWFVINGILALLAYLLILLGMVYVEWTLRHNWFGNKK